MGANFSGGGATVFHDRTDSPGEIVTELVNATDGQGLHFDGAAGNIDIASPPDLGAFAVYINNGAGYATTTTTMTVDALSAEIPAGTVLTFSGGGEYIVTTTAAASATSIVSTSGLTGAAVADNEGAAYGGANKFSFEFVVQADSWTTATNVYLTDFGNGGRFIIGSSASGTSGNFAVYGGGWGNFGINPLDDFKVHHIVVTIDGTAAVLYDNGNLVATAAISESHGINNCIDARIGAANDGSLYFFTGLILRARLWNKTLSQAEVTASYENATVPFADQYGSQTELVSGSFANSTTADRQFDSISGASATGFTGVYDDGVGSNRVGATLTAALTAGKNYRATFDYTGSDGGMGLYTSTGAGIGGFQELGTLTAASATGHKVEFTVNAAGGDYISFIDSSPPASGSFVVSNLSLVEIGVVSDYDLAFANQKQSLVVEDRSGSSDTGVNATGMMSASGVTQVTPIEQLNSKSARIGTSAVTAPDGQLVADSIDVRNGYVRIIGGNTAQFLNTSNNTNVEVKNSGGTGVAEMGLLVAGSQKLTIDSAGNVGIGCSPSYPLEVQSGGVGTVLRAGTANVSIDSVGSAASPSLIFNGDANSGLYRPGSDTIAIATAGADRLTIDSAGNVDIADGDLSVNGEATIERFASYRNLTLQRAQGTSASPTTIANTQTLGKLSFKGYTGSVYREGAAIAGKVSAYVGGDEIPTSLVFYTAADGATSPTVRLTIDHTGLATFSAGIAFSGQTDAAGMTATTLNHYEEGTFTLNVNGDSTGVFENETGNYTRIGNLCYIRVAIDVGTNFTSNSIGGLPFPCALDTTSSSYSPLGECQTGSSADNPITVGLISNGTSAIYFTKEGSLNAHLPNTTNDIYRFNGCYRV